MNDNVNSSVKRHKRKRRISIKTIKPRIYRPINVDYDIVEESIEIIVETEYIVLNSTDIVTTDQKETRKSTVIYDIK